MMVLSFIPSRREKELLTIQEADEVRRIIDEMAGTKRLLIHGRVNPNQPGDFEGMDELARTWGVSAWKCYTQWGPGGRRSEEHTSELQSLMRISYAVFCLKKKKIPKTTTP